jgi:hypothetical protein
MESRYNTFKSKFNFAVALSKLPENEALSETLRAKINDLSQFT